MADKSDLESFMDEVKPGGDAGRKSVLDDYASDIAALRKRRYTIDQICLYLKQKKNLDAKRSTVASFINRKSAKKARTAQQHPEHPAQTSAPVQEEKPGAKTEPKTPPLDAEPGKYDV